MNARHINQVVERLSVLYENTMAERAKGESAELVAIDIATLMAQPIRSRVDCVVDRESGLEYAAWCIGETLGCVGGRDLMHKVFDAFEEHHGSHGASWLDHRWDGIRVLDDWGWYA